MKSCFVVVFAMLALGAVPALAQPNAPSITGQFLPGMDKLDVTMIALMTKYACPGAQLAVTRNGRLVLARGYGFADTDAGIPVQPDSLFRIASNTKLITAAAVLTLVEEGKLDLDARAFSLIPQFTPLPGVTPDPRLQNITVRQILHHTGGWDRDVSGDPMFNSVAIAAVMGTATPASATSIIRYMLGRPLDFDPGSRYAYSNFGYCVLGRIIETVSGQPYGDFVQAKVFAKAGVTRLTLGRSLLDNRSVGEVRYYDYSGASLARSVFSPTGVLVPWPYGGFNLEAMDAHGSWISSAIDYVRVVNAIDGTKSPALLTTASIALLTERPAAPVSVGAAAYYGMGTLVRPITGAGIGANWWHEGSLPGTVSYFVRLANGWTWAVAFNSRPLNSDPFAAEIDTSINAALATISPPAGDLFAAAVPMITAQPNPQSVVAGDSATLSAAASGATLLFYQWSKDGVAINGATNSSLTVSNMASPAAGVYTVVVSDTAGPTISDAAIVGLTTTSKVIGNGGELQPTDIHHPNGNVFDQVLLNGAAETITADVNQVTRTSYVDLNDDIVQIEFSGAGALSLILDNSSGPAQPVNYNQPTVSYMKGHAGIVITGANETTNVSVFTVGRVTAVDPTGGFNILLPIGPTNNPANNGSPLFAGHAATAYDGVADMAFIAIASTNGKFGGLHASNASCFGTKGLTGIYAPGVTFTGSVYLGDINASDAATPAFIIGSSPDTRITGGSLLQTNGQPVKVSGLTQLKFTAGVTSNNVSLPARPNKAVLQQNGADVTSQIVVNP